MDMTFTMTCARCGRTADANTVHDGKGNAYCHACLEHLHGHSVHQRGVPILCERCGEPIPAPAPAAAKGRYCPDCVARLRGQRPARRALAQQAVVHQPVEQDVAFEQMLADIFEPPRLAAAG